MVRKLVYFRFNFFEIYINKRKYDIFGRKFKYDMGLFGILWLKVIKKVGIFWYVVKYNKWIIEEVFKEEMIVVFFIVYRDL